MAEVAPVVHFRPVSSANTSVVDLAEDALQARLPLVLRDRAKHWRLIRDRRGARRTGTVVRRERVTEGGEKNMMEKIQDAMRALLASTIVQCCEAVDEYLVHRLKGSVAARRERT